jgi:hypothetical protein
MPKRTVKGLKDIVPPPEMCQKIPDYFPGTALVWQRYGDQWWVNAREFDATDYDEQVPAPTLEELCEEIENVTGRCIPLEDLRPAQRSADALQTWFDVTGALDDDEG